MSRAFYVWTSDMTRKMKTPSRPEPGFRLTEHPVKGARPLITIGPEHAAWTGIPFGCDEAIVRLIPPEGATDETIQKLVQNAKSIGAVAVKILPRRRSEVVVEPMYPTKDGGRAPAKRARDVVLELVSASNVEDREKLVEFCEQVMGRCSL